jgi:hypothetical protein
MECLEVSGALRHIVYTYVCVCVCVRACGYAAKCIETKL